MAGQKRGTFSDLRESLLAEGSSYSFFQAVRLLRLMLRNRQGSDAASLEGRYLRIRPELTLGFPAADVAGISETLLDDGESRFIVYATFLGLYGTSSPLPSFYTEDLLFEAGDDKSVTRDFLDIINSTIYPLFVSSLFKYNIFLQICEENSREYLERIFCLMGMYGSLGSTPAEEEENRSLLRYSGIMSQYPRSAAGLKSILSDALRGIPVHIRECIPQMVAIPQDQSAFLGESSVTLGEDLHLGSEIPDCMGKFRIILGPAPVELLAACLPGGEILKRAAFLVEKYLDAPLEYDFELLFRQVDLPVMSLGLDSCSTLGVNSWLGKDDVEGYVSTRF
jgi:type VI secretion system protein ImpH